MKLEVLRFSSNNEATNGLLFDVTNGRKFLCYTLEDEYRTKKVYAETRIPSGTYDLTLRKVGRMDAKYKKKFRDMHKGMLWVRNVFNFEYILIHIGNDDDDSAGCLLVGNTQYSPLVKDKGFIGNSTDAYKYIYPYIADVLDSGQKVTITYVDLDVENIKMIKFLN